MKKLFLFMLTVMMTVFSLQVKAQGTITLADGTETSSLIPVYGLYADDDDFTASLSIRRVCLDLSWVVKFNP